MDNKAEIGYGSGGRAGWRKTGTTVTTETKKYFFKRFYLLTSRERGREGEGEGEKHQRVVASHVAPTGDLAGNPGMCPDWDSNQ